MRSIAAELWDEWTALPGEDEETDSSELAGLAAALPFKKNEDSGMAFLGSSRLWALRRMVRLWKNSRWKLDWNVASSLSVPLSMKGRVELSMPPGLYDAVAAYEGNDRWAWVRGVWGGCGTLYAPKTGYYLVIRTHAEAVVRRTARILQKAGISASGRTYGKHELIVRAQQDITVFLNKIGLTGASLRVEDKAILRAMRDQANRIRNCDTANINKALKAAEEQSELAASLLRDGLVETLPQNLRVLVEARLEHPEESLSELGRRLSPPVTKSTVKYRWARLQKFIGEAELADLHT
ncbi:MAG: DNA-binding protein WhiA [Synergistaceae bacterium]|nr:DNA-binding protein WhiA [Synergistaceae bacterium]